MKDYTYHYDSPLGGITLGSDGESLTGLCFMVRSILPEYHAGGIDKKIKLLTMEKADMAKLFILQRDMSF